ncbi:MAG: CocE/NonD family hydrolase [Myxococcales bacterium]|nr:CocE/NonD family hydrolase [Myxococcales bacterium]
MRLLVRSFISGALLAAVAVVAACGDDEVPPFDVRPSVQQLHVTHAPPATELAVFDRAGAQVAVGTTDELGSLMFRGLAPGDGYVIKTTTAMPALKTRSFEVMSVESSKVEPRFYSDQALTKGYQYIRTRDGTTLSAYITFPAGDPPYPTVVSYSGYEPSKPGEPIGDGSLAGLCDGIPSICDAPNDPSALIASFFGYATVNVNIRGTGCSGGAFDFFETMQLLDGYDVIETVGAQPWVMNNKVGMVGLSYPGITQLFVAQTQPPHLAAIAPLSVIGAANTTMLPGGILNDGFATAWITNVISKAKPYGQGWEQSQVDKGDTVCAENQLLHGQYIDNVEQARQISYYVPAEHDRFNLATFVDKINVPVFLASAWQDEQTGPYFFTMLDKFTSSPALRMTVYNGVHIDAFQPAVLQEWGTFLELFVAKRVPIDLPVSRAIAPQLYETVFGVNDMRIDASRFVNAASYDAAVSEWMAEPPLRALFESGAGGLTIGEPVPTFEQSFARWPAPGTTPLRLYAHPDGALLPATPTALAAPFTFKLDPDAGRVSILAPGGDVWDVLPDYRWPQPAAGSAVVFDSAPLAADTVMYGTASVDLWLRSPVDDADLEVNLTEIRPDGQEMYIQSGWIRASLRGSGPGATELDPAPAFTQALAAPLVPGAWTQVRVGTAGIQHAVRAGSRLRVTVDTPGGSRAEWFFLNKPFSGDVVYEIGHDGDHPSSVVLPVVPGVSIPSPLPPCPSLRGQQCRTFAPYANTESL